MKILSPAGNFESLKLAIYYGADEVYLGINDFNARNNIDGFNFDDLDEIVFFSHLHKVKVNLAVNILFTENELQSTINLIVGAYNKGVDSFIIQDLALASILHKTYPQIELHASTQMGIHNLEGVRAIEKYGFKRVVLARETPLNEIQRIKNNSSIEIEYFAQGALCVCFSGNCYLSSYLLSASGNRGKCKQLCRLSYSLLMNGRPLATGYLLSAKDFNMSSSLEELEKAGVDVIKIEGRARRPFYVAITTMEYHNALNGIRANQDNLKLAFNRDYTRGYFDGNGDIISKYNNHIGLKIGTVTKVNYGKKFNEIYFTSNRELENKSAIKLFDGEKEVCAISLYDLKKIDKNTYLTTSTQHACKGNSVNLISSSALEEKILNYKKKCEISIDIEANFDKQISAKIKLGNDILSYYGEKLEKAKTQSLSINDVQSCFEKTELYNPTIRLSTNGVFIAKSKLNEFRRNVYDRIKAFILSKTSHNLPLINIDEVKNVKAFENFKIVENNCEQLDAKNIVYSPETYDETDILDFKNHCEKEGKIFYLDLPNFALEQDVDMLRKLVEKNKIGVIANNYYALNFNCEKVAGGGLNVYNKHTANELDMPVICAEDCFAKKTKFPYMTLRHCPFKCNLNATCAHCPYSQSYELKMQNGKILKIKRKKLSTCTFYLTD